jgi:3',5'-cyclic AMP phosphodiesterase CpdA
MLGWLRQDLAANPTKCTLVAWHHPLFSSGAVTGSMTKMKPAYRVLYDNHADVVLSSHDHIYERFAPQDPEGVADPKRGIREFVVGTGGGGLHALGTAKPNSEVRNNDSYGVLKMTLKADGYDWEFVPVTGNTFTDSGSDSCH